MQNNKLLYLQTLAWGGVTNPITQEQIQQAVNAYLEDNPVSGMTDEQVQQLNQVAQDVAKKLNSNLGSDNVGKYLVVGEDGNIIVSDGITGENKDNGLDYKITTKVKDNSLIAVLTYTLPEESNPDPNPEYDNLNNIAISGKTYKEIFVDGNLLLGTDFEDRLDNFIINSGNPKLSTDYYVSPTHSLKCFGNTY